MFGVALLARPADGGMNHERGLHTQEAYDEQIP